MKHNLQKISTNVEVVLVKTVELVTMELTATLARVLMAFVAITVKVKYINVLSTMKSIGLIQTYLLLIYKKKIISNI